MEYEEIAGRFAGEIDKLAGDFMASAQAGGLAPEEAATLARALFDAIAQKLEAAAGGHPTRIQAQNAVLEVCDGQTGLLYRRWLELGFEESGNGIRLTGETMAGQPASIVFLSAAAIEKINELKGSGPDSPRCEH